MITPRSPEPLTEARSTPKSWRACGPAAWPGARHRTAVARGPLVPVGAAAGKPSQMSRSLPASGQVTAGGRLAATPGGTGGERVSQLIMDLRAGLVGTGRLARTAFGFRRSCAVADEVGDAGLAGGSGFCGVALGSCANRPVVTCGGGRDSRHHPRRRPRHRHHPRRRPRYRRHPRRRPRHRRQS